jgi:hypothetical protein
MRTNKNVTPREEGAANQNCGRKSATTRRVNQDPRHVTKVIPEVLAAMFAATLNQRATK